MRVIENGKIREMTAEEVKAYEQKQEFAKSLITETAKDHVEEFIDRIAEIDSITDIIKIAKDIKAKRGGNK
jgi:ethanolamine ammonia-lyase large subunit